MDIIFGGYRIIIMSQIGSSDCIKGYEFEFKTDNKRGLGALLGRHRNDPDFNYNRLPESAHQPEVCDDLYDRIVSQLKKEGCLRVDGKDKNKIGDEEQKMMDMKRMKKLHLQQRQEVIQQPLT